MQKSRIIRGSIRVIPRITELLEVPNNENNVWIFDDEMLEYLPEGFEGNEDECKKFAEAIGKYGEEIAEKELKKYIEEQKTIMPEKVIEMFNMNTETYKQAGYDFEIIFYDKNLLNDTSFDRKNNEDTRIKRTYVEVKSHEVRSKLRNHIVISNEQYNMAIKKADDYILLKVDIDSKSIFNTAIWEKVGIKAYRDLINCEKNMIIRPEYLLFQVK